MLDIQKQDDGSFKFVAIANNGAIRRTIGVVYRVDDAEALFAWKERNDGLQHQVDKVLAMLKNELIENPVDQWQYGFNAGLFRICDALGMTDRDDGDNAIDCLVQVKKLVRDALYTEGKHHKQWYLEQIIETLGIDLGRLDHEMMRAGNNTRVEGIAP